MRSRPLLLVSLVALLSTGCAAKPSGGEGKTPTATGASSMAAAPGPARPPTTAMAPRPGAYEVHEWGVVDVPAAGPIEIAAGPGAPSEEPPRPVKKPVLYFHLDPGAAPLDVDVRAQIPRGSMLEVWPKGELGSDAIRWPRVHVAACAPLASGERPTSATASLRGSGWPTRDGFNEVFDLPAYETSDSACLTSGDAAARLLFYRGSVGRTRLPIELDRDAEGGLALRASVPGRGAVLVIRAGGRGSSLAWPAVGKPVSLAASLDAVVPAPLDGPKLTRTLAEQLTNGGLTNPEAAAFLNAWTRPFFGVEPALARAAATPDEERGAARRERDATCAMPIEGPAASVVYVMPEEAVNDVAALAFTPPPRALRRVMVVRLELPGR